MEQSELALILVGQAPSLRPGLRISVGSLAVVLLIEEYEHITTGDVARLLELPLATAQAALARAEAEGWLASRAVPGDRRLRAWGVTPAGLRMRRRARQPPELCDEPDPDATCMSAQISVD